MALWISYAWSLSCLQLHLEDNYTIGTDKRSSAGHSMAQSRAAATVQVKDAAPGEQQDPHASALLQSVPRLK
jgi:hypothetical protein